MPGQKSAQKPNDWASFHDFQSAKIENFQQVGHFFHSFINYYTFFVKNCQKPNARACTSVPTFIRESPPLVSVDSKCNKSSREGATYLLFRWVGVLDDPKL